MPAMRPIAPRLLLRAGDTSRSANPDTVPARHTATTSSPDSKWLVMPNCVAASDTSSERVRPICAHGANSDGVARTNDWRTGAATRTRGTSEASAPSRRLAGLVGERESR